MIGQITVKFTASWQIIDVRNAATIEVIHTQIRTDDNTFKHTTTHKGALFYLTTVAIHFRRLAYLK